MSDTTARANPLHAALEDFEPPEAPREKSHRPDRAAVAQVAEQNGFVSRDPSRLSKPEPQADAAPKQQRRYTTGRNQQINIKATPQTIEKFHGLADRLGLKAAEVFELAVQALEEKHRG